MTINKKLIPVLLLLIIIQLFCTRSMAQDNLSRMIAIDNIKQEPMAGVLDKIASKEHFSFAYNNKTVPADSLVSVSRFRGTLVSLLDQMLGRNYEYKEVPGYIVLRYAPQKLSVTAELSKEKGEQTVVKGTVSDAAGQTGVAQASVYEKNLLVSTLTDNNGHFELKLKTGAGSVMLAVSKENYRDTVVNMLQEVVINGQSNGRNYTYYPNNGRGKGVEHNRFARLFLGSKQLMQDLNLGNFFATAPYQVSLIPGFSSHGMYNSQIIDHFSLNVFGGYTAGIDGAEIAGLFNFNRNNVSFLQVAGLSNIVGGSTRGIQLAGLYNNVSNTAWGLQVAGLLNQAHYFTGGIQMAGLANMDQEVAGLQVAGLMNSYNRSKGITLAGLTNFALNGSWAQIAGLLNKSGDVGVLQLAALMNKAKKVKGIQIGLINAADSSDYPVGLINFIKNGEKSITLSTDETLFTHVDFRSGGRVFYSLLGAAYKPGNDKLKYGLNIGLGAHIINRPKFCLNTEYVAGVITDINKSLDQYYALKLMPGYNITRTVRLFAGPSLNFTTADAVDYVRDYGWILNKHQANAHINTTYIGVSGGLQFVW